MSLFYQRSGYFKLDIFSPPGKWASKIFSHLQETEHPDLEGFLDTEVDRTGNPNINIWRIPQFSSIYTGDFTTHTCSK